MYTLLLDVVAAGAPEQSVLVQDAAVANPANFSAFDMLLRGGFIMIPIAFLSLLSVYLFVERYLYIQSASRIDKHFLESIQSSLYKYDSHGALAVCKMSGTPMARILEKGITRIGLPVRDMESAMESMARVEVTQMEKNLGILAAIATIAPMLGFLGTVTGMIKTFYSISLFKNISIDIIAGGIYEKMVTSAAGLVVGIVAYMLYTVLTTKIERSVSTMELVSLNFLDTLCQSNNYELQAK